MGITGDGSAVVSENNNNLEVNFDFVLYIYNVIKRFYSEKIAFYRHVDVEKL